MAPNSAGPVCPNGHQQPSDGTKFCIYCGAPIAASAAPPVPVRNDQQAAPPSPVPPAQQMPGNVQPPQQYMQQPPPAQQQHYPQQPQQYMQQQYPQQQYAQVPVQYQQQYVRPPSCRTCGGYGQGLPDKAVVCPECNWLRPIVPGYSVDNSAFAWAADAKAMSALRAMKPLNAAARAVSQKVGRRWIEASFNGVLLGERQLPHIYGQAVRAARILGMTHMPDVYLSGERAWDCLTFGTDNDSFVVIGSALAGNFQGADMLFLLAREMGHCKAGHALWKTVIRFFLGEQGPQKGFMAGGIFNAILSPTALVGGALEMPLLAWARQAEITADRAGVLTVGSEEVARRVLLSWSLRSSFMFKQINIEKWLEQQQEDDGSMLRLSELTTSSTPYLAPRLKLLSAFVRSPEYNHCLMRIRASIGRAAPPKPKPEPSVPAKKDGSPPPMRLKCSECGTPMTVPRSALAGKAKLSVKCPQAKCGKITVIQKKIKASAPAAPRRREENQDYAD